jgi:hypothetical protein
VRQLRAIGHIGDYCSALVHYLDCIIETVSPDSGCPKTEKEKKLCFDELDVHCSARELKTEFGSPSRRYKNVYQDLKKKEIFHIF